MIMQDVVEPHNAGRRFNQLSWEPGKAEEKWANKPYLAWRLVYFLAAWGGGGSNWPTPLFSIVDLYCDTNL